MNSHCVSNEVRAKCYHGIKRTQTCSLAVEKSSDAPVDNVKMRRGETRRPWGAWP
jgi:hypothetical protein